VANRDGRNLAAVDLGVFSVAKRIPLEADPAQVLAHPRRPLVYAVTPGDGLLTEVSATTLAITRKAMMAPGVSALRWSHDGRALWLQARQEFLEVDPETLKVTGRISLPGVPTDYDFSPETPDATASFAATNEVAVLDLTARRITRTVKLGSVGPVRVLKNQILAAQPAERLLTILDAASGDALVHLPLAVRPDRLCFSADRGQLFINGEGADAVVVVYPYQSQVAATLLAGRQPGAMAATGARPPHLFVANPTSNSVTVVDILTQRVVAAVPVGEQPSHIEITPDQAYALVLNQASGDLSVLWTQGFSKIVRRERTGPMFLMVPVGSGPVSAAITV
jgi:YVTN family beta-propeller protein